ncbi:MobF family relaxase [Amycolatopsis saalfeldensis]|uniref:MobF family relaxase n=1 Tax=Amycolatopsis saalfeldensis TaxID=394193 RepID=UPI0011606170|nr:MobF family relaxase [Amycolatopsis saalfeldensis]
MAGLRQATRLACGEEETKVGLAADSDIARIRGLSWRFAPAKDKGFGLRYRYRDTEKLTPDLPRATRGERCAQVAWVTPIGSAPEQIDYRLGQQHGCTVGEIDDAQLDYRTEQERPLVWVGEGLADLGIQAGTELTEDQFDLARKLVNGYHPHTGEQLVEHKLGVPREAKVQLAPLVRAIEGVAREANIEIAEVLRHSEGRWAGRTSTSMLAMFRRAQRAVAREGELATLRADHAGRLADAAGLPVEDVWGLDVYTDAAANLTKTITVTAADGTTTEEVVDNRVVVGNLAYDFSIGLHKSVVLLREFADERTGADLDRIFTDEAMKNFAWLEKQTAYGMRGHHGDGHTAETIDGNGYAGWAMIHRSARPTEGQIVGDPHWHVHFTIANMTKGSDGRWSTVAAGGRDLMRHAAAADRLMQASARKVLTERYGITWRRSERTRNWEVAAIPDAAIREFSQRGANIEAMLRDLGFTENTASAAVKRMVSQETRLPKTDATTLSDSTLREHYQARARAAGLDPDAMSRAALNGPAPGTSPDPNVNRQPTLVELATLLQSVEHGLTSHSRRFSRVDALCAVADALPAGGSYEEVEALTDRVLEDAGFVPLVKAEAAEVGAQPSLGEKQQLGADHMANAHLYTTQDIVDAEKVIVVAAQASHDDQTSIRVPGATAAMAASTIEATNGFALSAEQRRELFNIVTSGRAIDALIGGPGAGKTTLMDAVRAAYQAEGFVIAGAATQGTAAQNLQAESGIPSRTVAQWLYRIKEGPGLNGVDVLVLDEAGMTNDRDRAVLYQAADAAGAKIVESGDPKQLRGVGCGSMFAVVHELVDGGELIENRRQADADERAAIAAWREGNYSEALTSWADRDRLVVGETGQETTASMLATWMDQRQGAADPFTEMRGLLMVASTNEQVDRLNAGAQAVRQAQGELGAGRTYDIVGGRAIHLRENDFIMIRVNERQPGQPDALNGYRGIIDRIHADGRVDVRWDRNSSEGRLIEGAQFSPEFIAKGGITHGYAITIHKSQGMTIGSDGATWHGEDGERRGGAVLFYAAGADNPGSFVAASRHKLKMWMFLARKDVEGHQDEYLLGIPKTAFERTRRVITKLIDRAKATETNVNDRPVLVDLGLLEESGSAETPAPVHGVEPGVAAQRVQRAERKAADTQRRTTATELLREEWGEHPAVKKVSEGAAFGAVARWLDRITSDGGDPRAALREIDPDDVIRPTVLDPSRVTAAALKKTATTATTEPSDPADPANGGTGAPKNKHQRRTDREERDRVEHEQRDQVADLLREQWGDHPAVQLVIEGAAFGAVAQNLATAAADGHDPRAVLASIDPGELAGKDSPSAFTAWKIRTMTDPGPETGQAGAAPAEPSPPAPESPARLDILVPAYSRAAEQLVQTPVPVAPVTAPPTSATASPAPAAQPAARRDAMWPSWLPAAPDPRPLTGRDRAVATAAAADAQRIRARVVELGRDAARERPDWVQQLGPAPAGAAARARYLAAITTIAAYREQHGVTGPEPLGPTPTGTSAPAYAAAHRAHDRLTQAQSTPAKDKAGSPATEPGGRGRRPDRDDAKPARSRADDARQRAQRILEQQRRIQPQADQDPRRQGPAQGPRPGY